MADTPLVGCPHCGKPMAFAPTLAGQVVACPHCRGQLQMPARPPAPPPPPPPPPRPAGPPAPPPRPPASPRRGDEFEFGEAEPPAAVEERIAARARTEPKCYETAVTLSGPFLWFGVLLSVLLALLLGYLYVLPIFRHAAGDPQAFIFGIVGSAAVLVLLVTLLLGLFLLRALVLVGVDTARNLRDVRTRGEKPGGR